MKIKITKWAVAYRKKTGHFLDTSIDFKKIKDSRRVFYADPFLFDYKGNTFLFVEDYDNKLGRGVISYSKFNKEKGLFDGFKEIIREDFHLSYPLVFEYENEIFLMPEANESNSLYIYKAKKFPSEWEKCDILINDIKLVDTTPFKYNGELFAISKRNENPDAPMLLLKIDSENWKVIEKRNITDDVSISRPGGNVFEFNNQYYMVTQDCKDDYGKALNLMSFTIDDNMDLKYHMEKRITPDMVKVTGIKEIKGIHTYNFSKELEVIDFKYPIISFNRLFWKSINLVKKKLCKKI